MYPEQFESKFVYFRRLCFLAGHMRRRSTKNDVDSSTAETNDEANSSVVDVGQNLDEVPANNQPQHQVESSQPETQEQEVQPAVSTFQLPPPPDVKRSRKGSEDEEICKDDDYYFLLSLHPYMGGMAEQQKLRLRMKFQKLIFKELFKDGEEAEDANDTKE
jgi:BESS motif